jgi:hypothetical protein
VAKLDGTISLTNLPPHRGLIINLCLYEVSDADVPAPHGGEPPSDMATDCSEVVENVHLEKESQRSAIEQTFSIEHLPGYYYAQIRAILFLEQAGAVLAQAEQFFFGRRPVRIEGDKGNPITFQISWPKKAIEKLHRYGTINPQGGG